MIVIENKDIKGEDYRSLVELALKKCDTFAFVMRRDMIADEAAVMARYNKLVEGIQDSFIEMKEQSEWETTMLGESTAYVFYYKLSEETKDFLQKTSDSLFGWISPYLPEDLMFFSGDDNWLAVCSHEQFFVVSEEFKDFDDLFKNIKSH